MTSSASVLALPPARPAAGSVLTAPDPEVPDDALTVDQLGSRIVGLAGRLAAATCRWLLLVAEFDSRDGCSNFGLPTTARWLSHCCGISRRTAVEHVRVARALAAFPELAGAMRSGRLSYSHARAIARLARDGERVLVDDLIVAAEHGTVGQLETLVRGLRTVDANEQDAPETTQEYVRHAWTSTSQWRLHARLDPERGAVVQAAVEQVARAEGITRTDALVRLAEMGLAAVADSARPPRPLRADERAAVLIQLDAAALPAASAADDAPAAPDTALGSRSAEPDPGAPTEDDVVAAAGARCRRRTGIPARIPNGPGLPTRVVERLLCAGRIRTAVIAGGGCPLDVGRTRRVVSDRQFRALLVRDGGCAHPGCGSANRLEAHHVRHWVHGGETNMANLVLLCQAHHLGHHNGEFSIRTRPTSGRSTRTGHRQFVFVRADGRELVASVDPSQFIGSVRPTEDDSALVDVPGGHRTGDRLDRDYAIAVLASARSDARRSA